MPMYDYRCKDCRQRFSLFFKTYAEYDQAAPACPHCGSAGLARLISGVAIQKPSRDFTTMSSGEMLSVLDSGDSRQVGELFQQVGGGVPELGADYHEATERLLQGEPLDRVEQDLQAREPSAAPAKPAKPARKPKSKKKKAPPRTP